MRVMKTWGPGIEGRLRGGHDLINIKDLKVVPNPAGNVSGRPFSELEPAKQRTIVERTLTETDRGAGEAG